MMVYRCNSLLRVAGILVFILPLLSACGPAQESQHMQTRVDNALNDVDRDRNSVRLELMELRQDIDNRMLQTEEELLVEGMTPEQRSEKEQLLKELEDNRIRVQQALLELEHSDDGSWLDVKTRSKGVTRSVDNWFERWAEREDLRG